MPDRLKTTAYVNSDVTNHFAGRTVFWGASTMRKIASMAAIAAFLVTSGSASAAVTICPGGGCSAQPGSNVLINKGVPGTSVTGTLNNAPATVLFSSPEQLIGLANGQSRVAAVDGVLNNPLTFSINSGLISALEFNIDALTNGKVFFTFTGGNSDGLVTSSYTLDKNGNNFFNAFDGTFSSVKMTFTNGATVADVAQFRLNTAVAAVPEPATWALMLLGFASIGFTIRRRRDKVVRLSIA